MKTETVVLYRPLGPGEIKLVRGCGYKKWPPRLPGQPIFYPVTNEKYAIEITTQWNVPEFGVGYVAKFLVLKAFMDQFEVKKVGADYHTEWWIPADKLDDLNKHMIGLIEIIGEYR